MKRSVAHPQEGPSRQGLALIHKLPLQIGLLIALIVAGFLAMAYREVWRLSYEANMDRLERVNREFAQIARDTQRRHRDTLSAVASDPAIRSALIQPEAGADGALRVLRDIAAGDARNVFELWDARGASILSTDETDNRREHRDAAASMLAGGGSDTARTGPIYAAGSEIHAWTVAPVHREDGVAGFVAQRRRILTPPDTEQRVRELVGRAVSVYYTTSTGDVWSTVIGTPTPSLAALSAEDGHLEIVHPTLGPSMAHKAAVGGTDWLLVTAIPLSEVDRRAMAFLRRALLIAVLLVAAGSLAALIGSRRLIGPLRQLTETAGALARGEYARRSPVDRTDEIGQLAGAFNRMAAQVEDSHAALERQYEDARRMTGELGRSNAALIAARHEAETALARAETATAMAEQAREGAESASLAKSQFLAMMSHEVRTPINAIMGYTDLLTHEVTGPISPKQRLYLERIRKSGDHLAELMNDLLDLTNIESGRLRMDRVHADAADAVDTAVTLVRPQAAEHELELEVDVDQAGGFYGDPGRVRQILSNLLSNAVKFTGPGGRICVTAGVDEDGSRLAGERILACTAGEDERRGGEAAGVPKPGTMTFIAVEDTGVGIEPSDLERIFLPFVQVDGGYTRKHGGTGLGLAISRRLARLMGGDLTVVSRAGAGSRFTLWLPTDPQDQDTASASPAAAEPRQPLRAASWAHRAHEGD